MKIKSAVKKEKLVVTTTGARFVFERDSIYGFSRIGKFRKVFKLTLPKQSGSFDLLGSNEKGVTLQLGDKMTAAILPDSMLFLNNTPKELCFLAGSQLSKYNYTREGFLQYADEDGGCIAHMVDNIARFMVFPARPTQPRPELPNITFSWGLRTKEQLQELRDNYNVGPVILWNTLYDGKPGVEYFPVGTPLGYTYKEPDKIRKMVKEAHSLGMKALAYVISPATWKQPWMITLQTIMRLKQSFELDGFYLDNATARSLDDTSPHFEGNFISTYHFVKVLRKTVGEEGILIHHNSCDPCGAYTGFKSTMIDTYFDYTLRGENWEGDLPKDPDDILNKWWFSEHNQSQAIPLWINRSHGRVGMDTHVAAKFMAKHGGAWRIAGRYSDGTPYGWREYSQTLEEMKLIG